MTETIEPLLVSASEAAKLLGVGRTKFYEMASTGRLGPMAIEFGKRRVWRVADLKSWVAGGCPCRDKWLAMQGGTR